MDRFLAFAAEPFTLRAPAGRAMLGLAALAALSGGSPSPAPDPGASLPRAAYGRLVAAVQSEIDRELGDGRIVVLDRSASPAAEVARLRALMPANGALLAVASFGDHPGAYAETVATDPEFALPAPAYGVGLGTVCAVGGDQPAAAAAEVGSDLGGAGLPAAAAHRWALWREVGRCLAGPGAAAAEAFAGLVALRHGEGRDLVARMASRADRDGAPVEPAARDALARVAAIGDGARVAGTSLPGLAALADRIADSVAPRAPARPAAPRAGERIAAGGATAMPGVSVVPASLSDEADEDGPDEAPGPRR